MCTEIMYGSELYILCRTYVAPVATNMFKRCLCELLHKGWLSLDDVSQEQQWLVSYSPDNLYIQLNSILESFRSYT